MIEMTVIQLTIIILNSIENAAHVQLIHSNTANYSNELFII